MVKKYADLVEKVTNERQFLDEQTKRTKYSRPGYNYIQPHTRLDNL